MRRSEPSRYPLAGLVVCGRCGKKLQGNLVRGHAFCRCKVSTLERVAHTLVDRQFTAAERKAYL
jgi:hypothetical protein